MFRKNSEILLVVLQQVSLHGVIGPKWFVRGHQFYENNWSFWIVPSNKFPCTFWTTRDSAGHFAAHIRHCSIDTELIDWSNSAKNQFRGSLVATDVYRQFSFSFAFQVSSFQSTGSTEYGVSAFTEVEHHVLSDPIPFSIRFVRMSSEIFLSDPGPRNDECPCVNFRAYSATFLEFAIHSPSFLNFSPYSVVVHWHEDDSSCKLLRFTLYNVIIFWILVRICNDVNPGNIFHSNSIGSPSIRSNSRYWDGFINHSIFSFHALTGVLGILPKQNTESENTYTFAVDNWTARSFNKVVLFQDLSCQLITDIPWISVCSQTNFLVRSNHCFIVPCGWFLVECKSSNIFCPNKLRHAGWPT